MIYITHSSALEVYKNEIKCYFWGAWLKTQIITVNIQLYSTHIVSHTETIPPLLC